ncbi:MAG: tRNA-binding protein, partial [Candidatus Rokubacteria bacterium]|nr:tRNA-binding protein [Candidatus Rokubacteria bacterium]
MATGSAWTRRPPGPWPSSATRPARSSSTTTRARSSPPSHRASPPVTISWADFEKVDMRVGVVVDAQEFPEARHPAYRLAIDFGPLGVKRSSARITHRYAPRDLVGRRVVAVVNFSPKRIGPFVSAVLVLGAYDEAG